MYSADCLVAVEEMVTIDALTSSYNPPSPSSSTQLIIFYYIYTAGKRLARYKMTKGKEV